MTHAVPTLGRLICLSYNQPMSAFAASLRPRAVGLVRLGVWLLALLNGARALALWPQGEWLRDLSVALDVRWRLAASLGWMVVMALALSLIHI